MPKFSLLLLLCLLLLRGQMEARCLWPPFRRSSPAQRFVTAVAYQGQTLLLQRTPMSKLPRAGRQAIRTLEAQLDACFRALPTSDTACVLRPAQSDSLFQAFLLVRDHYLRWNTDAYYQEVRFYERTQAQRHLQRLVRQFTQAQHQLDSLHTKAQAGAATALFAQAAQASQAAEKAQQWVQAEVYLARCLAWRPTDAALQARHVVVSEQCLRHYFTRFVRASRWAREQASASTTQPLRREPVYRAAEPRAAYYLGGASADYAALALGGQPAYLYQQVEVYELARELLPAEHAVAYASRAAETQQAYRQGCGADGPWRDSWQLLRETQQRGRGYWD